MTLHRVKRGETLRSIASEYGVSPIKLAVNNGLTDGGALIPGEELLVLIPTRTVNAKRGETLSDIARRFGVRESTLIAQNPELNTGGGMYEGQPITVKQEAPRYGLGIGNGYFYRGTGTDRLMRALPYLNYVTVCSAVARRGGVSTLFDAKEAISLSRAAGKLPLLRLYIAEGERVSGDLMRSAALMAEAEDCHGVTLAGNVRGEDVRTAKEVMHASGLKLVLEQDVTCPLRETDMADLAVLTYDKIHLEPIPSFEEGEMAHFKRYADTHDAYRAFIDLSPFALTGGKFIGKDEAREAVVRGGGSAESIGESGCLRADVGRRGHERSYIRESLGNTEARLRLVSELGYYGVSFDIARTPIAELMMFRAMFSEGIGMV